jgi:hypothetical protein
MLLFLEQQARQLTDEQVAILGVGEQRVLLRTTPRH